ncbi:hypothetical protein [Roseateles sp. L2-2]|uniref:hypothetical protein n=1 Tax=Roseateles sp. L2-2 TaxID=3422597 RepID=UPI003D360DD4
MTKIKKSYIRISIISSLETSEWEVGRSLLEALIETDARLLPEKVGTFEPLKNSVSDVEGCKPFWAVLNGSGRPGMERNADGFIWKRSRAIKSYGHMMHKLRNIHGEVRAAWFVFEASIDRKVDWLKLFDKFCRVLVPDYATLHLVTEIEDAPDAFGEAADATYGTNDHLNGVPPIRLKEKGPANLAWANYFGPGLMSEVQEDKIRNAGFPVERLGDGIVVRVTDDIFAVEDDFIDFSRRRAELRGLFRSGLFRINHEPKCP